MICSKCQRDIPEVSAWPLYCSCGNKIEQPSRGLGDTVAQVIKTVTAGKIQPCGACLERQRKLNELFPYKSAPSEEGTE